MRLVFSSLEDKPHAEWHTSNPSKDGLALERSLLFCKPETDNPVWSAYVQINATDKREEEIMAHGQATKKSYVSLIFSEPV